MAGGPSHRRQRPTVAGFDLVATTPTLVMAASTSSPPTSRADPGHNDSAAVHALSSCRVADICRAARLVCLEEASAELVVAHSLSSGPLRGTNRVPERLPAAPIASVSARRVAPRLGIRRARNTYSFPFRSPMAFWYIFDHANRAYPALKDEHVA